MSPVLSIERSNAPRRTLSRRGFLKLAATVGATAVAGDSFLFEPNRPEIVRREIKLRRWPAALNGFAIAVLSDFHYDPYFSIHPLHAAISMMAGLQPNLIVLTGDFVSIPATGSNYEKAAAAAEPCAELLRQMHAPCGLWAVLGNHDYETDSVRVTGALTEFGIPVLANNAVAIESGGARFWLSGVKDVLSRTADLDAATAKIPTFEATVLLAHEPDYADRAKKYPVDLQISGHSHGGQVRIPFLPPLYEPPLARKYVSGLYQVGPLALYTNRGLGTVGLPVRFNCLPEITVLSLQREERS